MDTTTSPKWGFGCEPVTINALPASFVAFFPVRDSTAGVKPQDISWADNLAAQRPITHHPAWSRVAVQAHPSTLRKGTIMKRVGLPTIRPAPAPQPDNSSIDAASESPDATEAEVRHVRRKLNSSKPSEEDAVLGGSPPSEAEIASSMMRAKVDVANCLLAQRATKIFPKLRRSRAADHYKIVPQKRRVPDLLFPEMEYAAGGTGLATYNKLNPILERAAETGVNEVDVHMASIAEASANLQQHTRRDPRIHLAACGLPDLSDIPDEPESPLALAKPARSRSDAKSPTKRATPQLSSPIKGSSRLSETVVKLVPASSPRAEPSPTKSSAPSTPFKDSPGLSRAGGTPSIPRSPILTQTPLQRHSPQAETPGSARAIQRLFQDSPSSGSHSVQQTPNVRDSPSTYARPVAPTPSRWNRREPSTPYQLFTPKAFTPVQSQSPLGLMASIPPHLRSNFSPIKPIVMGDPKKITFGPTSPSFDHGSWLNMPVKASERERVKNLRRRKSEPNLIRNCLIAEARRKSVSPLKLLVKCDDKQAENSAGVACPSGQPQAENDGPNNASADTTMDESTAAPTYARYVNNMRATAADSPTPSGRFSIGSQSAKQHGIFDIDMRQNPDIFGVQAPTGSTNPAIEQLARMAEDQCNGDAKVVVTQENGRLVVRFKLPTMYASMFPDNQGADESHFTTSPSAISSSPRIRFQNDVSAENHELTVVENEHEESTVIKHAQSDLHSSSNKMDKTLAVSDFGSSPVAASNLFEDTTALSFPSAAAMDDGTTIPGLGYSSSPEMSKTPKGSDSLSSLSDLERTPSVNGSDGLGMPESPLVVDREMASTPARASNSTLAAPANGTPIVTQDAATSFTPVNQASTRSPASGNSSNASKNDNRTPTQTHGEDDSPEREYMRDFIKRSKPKRLSATESGSPIAPPQRLPLGAKSPNAESPQKGKRKFEGEDEENESETKQTTEPAPKRACRAGRATPRKSAAVGGSEDDAVPTTDEEDASDVAESADAQEDDEEPEDAPVARRSSRLRGKSTTAKSSIPTPIKVGRGRGGAALLNSVRSQQQDLNVQTRMNTRKNKGSAEYPAQVLARCSEEVQEDLLEQQEMELMGARDGKSVGWKEPLTVCQEEEKAKGGKGAPKTTAKAGSSRVAKAVAKTTAATQRQRTARVTAGLGMAGNGTPAKRVTRSQARSQK